MPVCLIKLGSPTHGKAWLASYFPRTISSACSNALRNHCRKNTLKKQLECKILASTSGSAPKLGMSAEDPLLNEAEAGEKSEKTNNEWKSSAKLAILAPLTYVCTYWWRTPLFCLPDSYTNVTILTLGSGVNISYATGSALAFAMGNIVGKTTAVFLFTSNFYYKHRFLVLSFMFCLTAFLNGFGIAAFDSENGFVAHSPLAQVIVAAGLGSIPVSTLFGGIFSYLEGRKSTDLLIAALNFGLIVAGGAARSSAVALIEAGVEPYLMPAVTAAAALVVALPLLFVVDRLPRPSVSDKHERSERGSMSCAQKLALFRRYKHVIGNILFAYMIVMGLRQYRDFFAVELYSNALGFTPTSWTYLLCDLPGALLSCKCRLTRRRDCCKFFLSRVFSSRLQ